MTKHQPLALSFILASFVLSFACGLDIFIPIVPQMTQIFNTTPALVQLTMSLFLLTTGIGQLFIGPLSDQWGRKKIFYASSLLFAFGSLGCAFSTHISWLIIARIVSSVGACGMLVTSFALIRDLFSSDESAKMYSFLNAAIGISPTFAPILGGYLAVNFGWQSIFYFLMTLGFYSFLMTHFYVEETHAKDKRTIVTAAIFKRYWEIFNNRQFIVYAMIAGFADSVFFCFFSTAPFLIIEILGVPTEQFGYYFAIFGLVISLGAVLGAKIIEKWGLLKTIKTGITFMALGGFWMLIWHASAPLSLASFLCPMILACLGAIFLVGSAASAALEPFPLIAGTASAAFGSIEFGISAVSGAILMLFPVTSTIPYGILIILMAALSSVFLGFRNSRESQKVVNT